MSIGIWIEWLSININHLSAFISPFTNPLLKVQRAKNSYAFSWSWKSSCNLHDFLEYLKWVKGVKSPLGTSFLSLFLFSCLLILLYFFFSCSVDSFCWLILTNASGWGLLTVSELWVRSNEENSFFGILRTPEDRFYSGIYVKSGTFEKQRIKSILCLLRIARVRCEFHFYVI